jgi:hypothetical protein
MPPVKGYLFLNRDGLGVGGCSDCSGAANCGEKGYDSFYLEKNEGRK